MAKSFFRIGETDETQFKDTALDSGTYFYYIKARNHSGGINGNDLGGESDATNILRVDIP